MSTIPTPPTEMDRSEAAARAAAATERISPKLSAHDRIRLIDDIARELRLAWGEGWVAGRST